MCCPGPSCSPEEYVYRFTSGFVYEEAKANRLKVAGFPDIAQVAVHLWLSCRL